MPLHRGLLVSTKRNYENSASSEIQYTLCEKLKIDESKVSVKNTRISGLITVKIDKNEDLIDIMRRIIALESDENYFMHCLKIRPVENIMKFNLENLDDHFKKNKISIDGSYKITVNKRHNPIRSMEIISMIAKHFKENKVDLNNPDFEIVFEIVADKVGYSIIEPKYVYSTILSTSINEQKEDYNWFLE
ncbi:MAG: THUMP domain-containing protein [Asgard group archaeon]|jgi:tRNA(Ser,Leu) C12 N-acetylase TAN1|nr:THUMP domain-containing protein [Asgard group archaeon]|tara:strand:- start:7 stop:576 length:570 start_codon:yes stop_codon:yes gene_type:complete